MKIIFFGTPDFAAFSLLKLIEENKDIVAVVTLPDRKKGRGKKIISTPVKEVANKHKIKVFEALKFDDVNLISDLENFNANIFVVVAFKFLPKSVWQIPSLGTINLHTSYLPNYKGAAPINRVIMNGERSTGISTFYINEKIDSGKLILRNKIKLENTTTAAQLYKIMKIRGEKILLKTINTIEKNKLQNINISSNKNNSYANKISKECCKINWNFSAHTIHNLVRGLSPYVNENQILSNIEIFPGAWTNIKINNTNKRVKILLTKIGDLTNTTHLSINCDNKKNLKISVNGRFLSILYLQLEGKKPMAIKSFLQGNKIDNTNFLL
tara:strand:+ start:8222 stop:9199 length:978 start_codon:yes stop_codon:yes gene_type:complete